MEDEFEYDDESEDFKSDDSLSKIRSDMGLDGDLMTFDSEEEKEEARKSFEERLENINADEDEAESLLCEFDELCWSNEDFNEFYTGDPDDDSWQDYID